jgi:tetratricopeptide (TPR) repeat protein
MAAAKQNGIPCAFIVGKDGHVEWIGHPMQMDDPLEKIVKGDWDREAAVKAMEEEARQQEAMQTAFQEMRKAQMDEDWDAALAAMDKLGELTGQDIRAGKLPLLAKAGKIADAKAILEELKTDSWDDAMGLNQLAWGLATEFPEELRDLDLALEMSTRSNELTDNGEANMLDTLARVYYEKGDLDKAIDWQMKAVAAAPVADELQATLDQYKAEKESPAEEEEESSSEESDVEEGSEETAEDKGDKEDK